MVPFMESLHHHSTIITESFVKGWNKGVLTAFGVEFQVNETLVANVTGLDMKGMKCYRDRKLGEEDIAAFYDK